MKICNIRERAKVVPPVSKRHSTFSVEISVRGNNICLCGSPKTPTPHSVYLTAWKEPRFLFWASPHSSLTWNSHLSGAAWFPFWWRAHFGVSWSLAQRCSLRSLQVFPWGLGLLFPLHPPCTSQTLALCLLTSLSSRLTHRTHCGSAGCTCLQGASLGLLRKPQPWRQPVKASSIPPVPFMMHFLECVLLFWAGGSWRLYSPSLATGSSIHIFSGIKTLKGLSFKKKKKKSVGRKTPH